MTRKLTLVSAMCRGRKVSGFIQLPIIGGKVIISMETLCDMFFSQQGFYPSRGETISIGC